MKRLVLVAALIGAALISACKQGERPANGGESTGVSTRPGGAAQTGVDLIADPGGKIVVVTLITDADGSNKFTPAEVMVNRGDVIRFTLKVGVHNVDFLPDSNPGRSGLPSAPSDMLQLPGQTYDVKVTFATGTYYFQCDPHALLGMKGHVMVH